MFPVQVEQKCHFKECALSYRILLIESKTRGVGEVGS